MSNGRGTLNNDWPRARTQNIMRLDLDDKYVYQPQQQQQSDLDNDSVYFGGVDDNKKDKLEYRNSPNVWQKCSRVCQHGKNGMFTIEQSQHKRLLMIFTRKGAERTGESMQTRNQPKVRYNRLTRCRWRRRAHRLRLGQSSEWTRHPSNRKRSSRCSGSCLR